MTPTKQAQIIEGACKEAGLECRISWHKRKADAHTWAERISARFFGGGQPRPVKNSYMYCDTLDMCFFFGGSTGDTPFMTYAGYVTAQSPDITEWKLEKAFQTANVVLQAMSRMAKEENNVQSKV